MYIAQVRIWLYIEDCRSNYNPNALPVHELQKSFTSFKLIFNVVQWDELFYVMICAVNDLCIYVDVFFFISSSQVEQNI